MKTTDEPRDDLLDEVRNIRALIVFVLLAAAVIGFVMWANTVGWLGV